MSLLSALETREPAPKARVLPSQGWAPAPAPPRIRAWRVYLTLAPAEGWFQPPPPVRFFLDSEKMAARSAAKFAIAVYQTIWHISEKTMTRWPQRSRDQVAWSDLTSSCVFRSLTSCQRHTSDPNSLKLAFHSKGIGVYNLYISDIVYRWPKVIISWISQWWKMKYL